MSTYKILTDKDDIILKKKDNKFKLETKKKVKLSCNIIELVESLEIYNLFKLINDKLISKCKIIKKNSTENTNTDIILCLCNIMKDEEDNNDYDSDENFYLSFTNTVSKKDANTITLTGKKNNIKIDKEGWKKIEIDDILIHINLSDGELEIKLSFEYIGEKMPMYAENTIGLVFRKIIKNLVLYYH